MSKKKTTEEFITDAIKIHGDKYDYSLVDYKGAHYDIEIICYKHNYKFTLAPTEHLVGNGCKLCGIESTSSSKIKTTKQFIEDAIKVHGNKYDYSLVDYKNSKKEVKMICPIHGEFKQIPNSHLNGKGCDECSGTKTKTTQRFIEDAIKVHGNKYDYSLVEYEDTHTQVRIICSIHGEFPQIPCDHLHNHGCPKCKESQGEKLIRFILDNRNIEFKSQKGFENCKYIKTLKFDFYLLNHNICIEYDGEQHFKKFKFEKDEQNLKIRQIKDKIKDEYCQNNNIKLYRIKYNENIQEKMNNIFREIQINI